MKYSVCSIAILMTCSFISPAAAQKNVVVVPLGGKKCTSPTENSFTNSIGMTFNLIPAGTFIMGSPESEPGYNPGELQHEVTLTRSFYMQVTEVTNKQWNIAMAAVNGLNPSGSHKGDDYPVENVSWYEAAAFANGLSTVEGFTPCYNGNGTCSGRLGDDFTCTMVTVNANCTGYRLPTEAEWEYAARAGTITAYANPFSFDDTYNQTGTEFNANLHDMGWYAYNDAMTGYSNQPAYPHGTKPVARKQSNRWGLYDMHGNVMEWCQDWLTVYGELPVTDPQGPDSGSYKILRGGAWNGPALLARSASRLDLVPDRREDYIGFRLVLPRR